MTYSWSYSQKVVEPDFKSTPFWVQHTTFLFFGDPFRRLANNQVSCIGRSHSASSDECFLYMPPAPLCLPCPTSSLPWVAEPQIQGSDPLSDGVSNLHLPTHGPIQGREHKFYLDWRMNCIIVSKPLNYSESHFPHLSERDFLIFQCKKWIHSRGTWEAYNPCESLCFPLWTLLY